MSTIRNYRRIILGVAFDCQRQTNGTYHVRVFNSRRVAWQNYGKFCDIPTLRAHVLTNSHTINF